MNISIKIKDKRHASAGSAVKTKDNPPSLKLRWTKKDKSKRQNKRNSHSHPSLRSREGIGVSS